MVAGVSGPACLCWWWLVLVRQTGRQVEETSTYDGPGPPLCPGTAAARHAGTGFSLTVIAGPRRQ